jgi:beta-lactamase regulating signal transducer with metallopeptidase domain
MLGWSAQTTVIAMVLAAIAILASRSRRLGPAARHVLWLVVMIKLVAPPVVNWPWSPPKLWSATAPAPIAQPVVAQQEAADLEDRIEHEDGPEKTDNSPTQPSVASPAPQIPLNVDILGQVLFGLWLGISATIAMWQIARIVRFQRRLAWVIPAPEWLVQEVRDVSVQLGVRAPEILVLPDVAPPMLWFLGRTKLLVPGRLVTNVDRQGADRLGLRAVLAHELAHLRRGDHWVRRLDFFAGLIWWWNPVYWLTRERLSTEAELACDEWAIRAVPDGRVSYAEALLDVCRTLSTTRSPAPALGVAGAGAGRFLERRVKMILQHQAPSRISVPVLLGAGLLFLVALPGWSAAGTAPTKSSDPATSAPKADKNLVSSATIADAKIVAKDDDDDDDDAKKDVENAKKDAEDAKKDAAAAKAEIAKELKKELGPGSDFQKEMKNLGAELKKQLGPGSDFEKEMKNLGPELQKELGPGSDFEKEMKNLGEELQKELGPGSDFQKNILSQAKEIEKKFGPGSDFERKMQGLGKKMAAKYGVGSEFAEKMKRIAEKDAKIAEKDAKAAKASSDTSSEKKAKTRHKAPKKTNASKSKARELKALRAQIDALNAQLDKLEKLEDGDEDE